MYADFNSPLSIVPISGTAQVQSLRSLSYIAHAHDSRVVLVENCNGFSVFVNLQQILVESPVIEIIVVTAHLNKQF